MSWCSGTLPSRYERNQVFGKLRKKAKGLAEEHGDKAEDAVDKAADFADDKTGGKYSDQIETGAEKVKDVVEGLAEEDE